MRRTLVVNTAATLVALTAVGGGGTAARAQQASDVDAVRAAATAFYAALSARDIRAMEGLWSRDADPMMIHPTGPYARTPAVGWEAVRRSLETVFARFSEFSVSLRDPQVRVGEAGAVVVGVTPCAAGRPRARWTTRRSGRPCSSGAAAAGWWSTTTPPRRRSSSGGTGGRIAGTLSAPPTARRRTVPVLGRHRVSLERWRA